MPPESNPNPTPEFITLAHLLRPQGRRGELLADLHTDFPEQLSTPAGVYLVASNADAPSPTASRIVVEDQWMPTGKNAGRIVLKLAGTDSISDAERLARMKLMVPATERPALEADTFYISDLIGCTLIDRKDGIDTPAGKVIDVEFSVSSTGKRLPDAAPLLIVALPDTLEDAEPALVPFIRAQLISVDTTAQTITMDLPEGLLDAGDL